MIISNLAFQDFGCNFILLLAFFHSLCKKKNSSTKLTLKKNQIN